MISPAPDNRCARPAVSFRRSFWSTQPEACGTYVPEACSGDMPLCAVPGLSYVDQETHITGAQMRTIATNDWMRSLILNILNTKARVVEPNCKVAAAAVMGHWSESYRDDGLAIGTRIWAIGQKPVSRIQDAVALFNATLTADLNKLVTMGVASKIEIETTYTGANRVSISITVYGPNSDENIIYLTSERLTKEWVWR